MEAGVRQSRIEYTRGAWHRLDADSPTVIVSVGTPRPEYWYSDGRPSGTPGTTAKAYYASSGGVAVLSHPGDWYLFDTGAITEHTQYDVYPLAMPGAQNAGAISYYVNALTGGGQPSKVYTMAAASAVAVGVASGVVLAATTGIKFLSIYNASTAGQRISLAFGAAAVLDSGITMPAGTGWVFDVASGISEQELRGISSAALGSLALQVGY